MKRIMDRGHDGGTQYRWVTISEWVNSNNWKNGVEIGVWKGETFIYLLNSCSELNLIGIDPYEPQPDNKGPEKWTKGENGHAWNHDKYHRDMLEFCKTNPRGKIVKDYSVNVSKTIQDESLDFIFIDGDHSYKGVKSDIESWYPKIKKHGWIIGHDIHFNSVEKAVTEIFGNDYRKADDFLWYHIKK
jgi:hypothetical protein